MDKLINKRVKEIKKIHKSWKADKELLKIILKHNTTNDKDYINNIKKLIESQENKLKTLIKL